ncbi:MUC1-extracellular alpha-1 4-glucan glucosidase [Fusarium mexicanum]|uniref:MUC1-extracellular alpha-1 4-glucan glucosidase n=1 Tax=Fusarium mexicanum TaxID=751941 RepID=A0A8H5ILY6_9HYPO|nr:MUC1-extracellular alpha-1 4-glucan glucosidase [Fusarium mexicanum]
MVVPVAACETGSVSYGPSGWYDGHRIQPGHGVDVGSQPQPTQGQQNGNGPDYENGLSNIVVATQGSADKAQGKQPVNSLPTQGHQKGNELEYADGPLNTGAATQESEGKAQDKDTANPLPTQNQQHSGGPNSKNGPLDNEAGAHGSGNEAQNTESPGPLPAQGQHNTDRPGDENHQSYVTTQPSPEHNIKNGPVASASQSIYALNPSKPSSDPQDQQPSSGGLTIEASVVPAPQPGTHHSPSESAPGHGHSPAISTTFATEVEATKDTEASGSTNSLSPSEPGEASSIPSIVSTSEAHKYQIMSCRMVIVIVGMVLLLQ